MPDTDLSTGDRPADKQKVSLIFMELKEIKALPLGDDCDEK